MSEVNFVCGKFSEQNWLPKFFVEFYVTKTDQSKMDLGKTLAERMLKLL